MSAGFWSDPAGAASWDAVAEDGPARSEQLGLLVALLVAAGPERVLELGVGSGRVAERVLDALPRAALTGIDPSAAMLDLARARLGRFGDRASLVEGAAGTPAGDGFDAAYTVQALHHLDTGGLARSLAWLAGRLRPGGLLLLRDKVAVPPSLAADVEATWNWRGQPEAGRDTLRNPVDTPVPLETLLEALRSAGLEPAVLHATGHYVLVAAR